MDFQFNGYGSDGRSHPTEHPPVDNLLPLKICVAYTHPYLIGVYPDRQDLAHGYLDKALKKRMDPILTKKRGMTGQEYYENIKEVLRWMAERENKREEK